MQRMSNGRVRRTEGEWREVLARWRRSGLAAEQFCRKQGIRLSSLQRWRGRLRGDSARAQFVRVTPEAPAVNASSAWTLEVILPNGVRLCFRADA